MSGRREGLTAVVLAAGGSTRLGRPKQLALLQGERLLDRAVRVAREAGCVPLVVLGASAEEVQGACNLDDCRIVFNAAWQAGMAGSLKSGIEAAQAQGAAAVLVMTCDQPAVTAEHLRRLAAGGDHAVASGYAGRGGVPAYFPASCFAALTTLQGDEGARHLLGQARRIDLPLGELDVDTEDKLRLAQELFGA